MNTRQILHVDLDAFFASVEQLDHPSYRGKPVIVGGLPGDRRSVVSTASYEARKFGVHSAMPTARAYQLCPNGIYVRGRMERYCQLSQQIMAIFHDFSPDVQQMSIDEAFIDITGTEKLFGSPESVARKLKETVLHQTGLTVSIGLASNKYLAKIASGMNKPDGLYVVPPGSEERFMLSLPLDKLWGVGSKTRTVLNDKGFYTIEDIHQASLPGLCQLFGDSTGVFLYQAVRGEEAAGFDEEPKSRSISNENTFSFDLTDRDIILTALLDLCYTVYFRLLSEDMSSRTVHLKIRYEDFSTVSIQETLPRYISSTDDFYERIVALFDRKYDRSRGIRLLGVGCQNLENGMTGDQGELFDFGEGKKRAVETAVLELQKKDRTSVVKKARQFLSAVLLCSGLCRLTPELPAEPLFSYDIHDAAVDILAEGSWESSITAAGTLTFPTGSKPVIHMQPPVYSQKTDLSLTFMLQNQWYFETFFADDFSDNTVAAGYYGNDFIHEVRIGNRGISFADHPALTSVGFGSGSSAAEAPGIMASFSGTGWQADVMTRFEQIESCSQTFQGMNAVETTILELGQWEQNRFFSPGPELTAHIKSVWVESAQGTRFDHEGRSFICLSPDQYLVTPGLGTLEINAGYGGSGAILVELTDAGIQSLNGSWAALVADIRSSFDDFPVTDYFDETAPRYTALKGSKLLASSAGTAERVYLYLKLPECFSPFVDASRYAAGTITGSEWYAVASSMTGADIQGFQITADARNRGCIIVHKENILFDADVRYPFADLFPQLYVPGHRQITAETTGTVLQVQKTTPVDSFQIGTHAIAETVMVRKNGVPVTARYQAATGKVLLDELPGPYDTITISWNEPGEGAGNPRLHTAFGATMQPSDSVILDVASSVIWPWTSQVAYSTPSSPQTGTAVASAYGCWTHDTGRISLSAETTAAVQAAVSDVTGILRIEGFDQKSYGALYLGPNAFGTTVPDTCSIRSARILDGTRAGSAVTLCFSSEDQLYLPFTFSSGAPQLCNAQSLLLWVKGTISGAREIYLEGGAGKAVAVDLSAPITNSTVTGTWTPVQITLTERQRHLLAEDGSFALRIQPASGATVTGEIALCGDSAGLQGLRLYATAENASSWYSENALSPRMLPAGYTWLKNSEPLQAARYTMTIQASGRESRLVSEDFLPAPDLSGYDQISCLLLVPSEGAVPQVQIDLLSDDGSVLLSLQAARNLLVTQRDSWLTLTHELTAAEKKLLKETPPVKRRLTLQVPAEAAIAGETVTCWYDELTARGMASDLLFRSVTAVNVTHPEPLFQAGPFALFTGNELSVTADTRLSPADGWKPAITGTGSAATTILHVTASGSLSAGIADHTGTLTQVTYQLQTEPDTPVTDHFRLNSRYHHDSANQTVQRTDAVTMQLEFPDSGPQWTATATATLGTGKTTRNQQVEFSSRFSGNSVSIGSAASFTQQVPDHRIPDWQQTFLQEFSSGSYSAIKRKGNAELFAGIQFPVVSLAPVITAKAQTALQTASNNQTDSAGLNLTIPLKIRIQSFSFEYEKEVLKTSQAPFSPGNRGSDEGAYGADCLRWWNERELLAAPFLELPFTTPLQSPLSARETLNVRETAGFQWTRPLSLTVWDLCIPSKASFLLGTESKVSASDMARELTGKGSLTFTSLNCFGTDGIMPLFDFYAQDETQATFAMAYTEAAWSWSSFLSESLYFADGGSCSLVTTADWKPTAYRVEGTLSWMHAGEVIDGTSRQNHEEFCTAFWGKESDEKVNRLQLSHRTTTAINDYCSISGLLQTQWRHTETADTIGFSATISGKLNY